MPLTTQLFQPIGTALASMPPRPGTGLPLSDTLISQSRMIAFEFIRLREERFGPDSHQTNLAVLVQATEGIANFLGTLQAVKSEPQVLEEAHLAELTLREIRALWHGDHFFSDVMKSFFEGFLKINTENIRFGEKLFRGLKSYREQRDEAESKFLVPFNEYRDQLRAMIEPLGTRFHFNHWEVLDRIKRRILSKLEARQVPNMDQVFDIAALKVLLGLTIEVDAASSMIRSAFEMHEEGSKVDASIPYYFKIDHIEAHIPMGQVDPSLMDTGVIIRENDRGYRGRHINLRRFSRRDNKGYPTAEIQLKTKRVDRIGEKQHPLAYKGDSRLPPNLKDLLKGYGRAAFDLAVDLDEGRDVSLPQFDLNDLEVIEDKALMYEVLERLMNLEDEMTKMIQEQAEASGSANHP